MADDAMEIDYHEAVPPAAKWIGRGLQWPKLRSDVPNELDLLYKEHYRVPDQYAIHTLYDDQETVSAFLARNLRRQENALTHPAVTTLYTNDVPDTLPEDDNNAAIPSTKALESLEQQSGQALLDGCQSVVHPVSRRRYPLWMVKYWLTVANVVHIQQTWRRGVEWLKQRPHDAVAGAAFEAGLQLCEVISCNSKTNALDMRKTARTSLFTRLLSNRWLSDEVMDMMVVYVQRRVEKDARHTHRVVVEGRKFVHGILQAQDAAAYEHPSSKVLQRVEGLCRRPNAELYFPLFLPERKHWIAVRVNFLRKEIAYGDSLSFWTLSPKELLTKLGWWLSKRFDGKFTVIGRKLETGRQQDEYSCGVCAVNAIVHDVFGDPLWTNAQKGLHRVRWFKIICDEHIRTIHDREPAKQTLTLPAAVYSDVTSSSRMSLAHLMNEPSSAAHVPAAMAVAPLTDVQTGHSEAYASTTTTTGQSALQSSPGIQATSPSPLSDDNEHLPAQQPLAVPSTAGLENLNVSPPLKDFRSCYPGAEAGCDQARGQTKQKRRAGDEESEETKSKKRARCSSFQKSSSLASSDVVAKQAHEVEQRRSNEASTSSQSEEKRSQHASPAATTASTSGARGLGQARSSRRERSMNAAIADGTFEVNKESLADFKASILKIDPRSDFPEPDWGKVVRHVPCGKPLKMKTAYNTANYERHCNGKDGRSGCNQKPPKTANPGAGTLLLTFRHAPPAPPKAPPERRPCPGLSGLRYPKVGDYLGRTLALGGGGRFLPDIAVDQFGVTLSLLSEKRKKECELINRNEWRWRNEHKLNAVFSIDCLHTVLVDTGKDAHACAKCEALLKLRAFQNAYNHAVPPDENLVCTNNRYRAAEESVLVVAKSLGLGDIMRKDARKSPYLQFALRAIRGECKNEVFLGMVKAVQMQEERVDRGVGMQNFKYSPAYDEFMHIINIHSPKTYRFVSKHVPARTQRSIQANEARSPRFPVGVSERTFALAAEHLENLGYVGPVSLSCDDTKLLPGLDPVYDKLTNKIYIVGGVGEPMSVLNPEEVTEAIANEKLKKADKLRLYVLSIPLPKAIPMILAALGISNKADATFLWEYHQRILDGLCTRSIDVIASASDGATVERAVHTLIEQTATDHLTYSIPHPVSGTPIKFDIPCYGLTKQPIVPVQDARHALKTTRNNAFTGTHLLTVGNYPVLYSDAREMGMADDGPLYRRDVEKVDRQDDNAATRLFSSAALDWLCTHDEERHRGSAVYYFVYGELCSAWDGARDIDLFERAKMALRAGFFTDLWEQHLQNAGYSKARHFLSHQAASIVRRLVKSFIQLIYVFRDHLGGRFPFLPWLISSSPCEHSFGLGRLITKDFTLLNWIYMMPKLMVQMRQEVFNQQHGDARARASGYNHTYTDSRGVDLASMRQFPSDDALKSIVRVAYEEAVSLFAVLGVSPADLAPRAPGPAKTPASSLAPSMSTAVTATDPVGDDEPDDWDDEEEDEDEDDGDEEDDDPTMAILSEVFDFMENRTDINPHTDQEFLEICYAAITLSIDTGIQLNELLEPGADEGADDTITQARELLHSYIKRSRQKAAVSPTTREETAAESSLQNSLDIDMSELVALRKAHETYQAKHGVRRRAGDTTESSDSGAATSMSGNLDDAATRTARTGIKDNQRAQRQLLRRMRNAMGEDQIKGICTGLERFTRWSAREDGEPTTAPNGNTANAEQAAKARASKAHKRRCEVMRKELPNGLEVLQDARISQLSPLAEPCDGTTSGEPVCAFVLVKGELFLGRVLSIYTKGGGKHGKHGWVPAITSVSAASYIPMQIYEHSLRRRFCAASAASIANGRRRTYALVRPAELLCKTLRAPKLDAGDIEVSADDLKDFVKLKNALTRVRDAVQKLVKKKRGRSGQDDDDSAGEEG